MCTRVLWNTNEIAVLTGRTMDWPESTESLIVAFPRGLDRDGGLMLGEVVVPENPLRWTSTHASLATTVHGIGIGIGTVSGDSAILEFDGDERPNLRRATRFACCAEFFAPE